MSVYGEAESVIELSKKLKQRIKDDSFNSAQRYQLIDVFDDLTIIWCKEAGCFYTQIYSSTKLEKNQPKIQTVSLSKPPIWEVQKILINKSGTGVLIWGPHGLAVIELPKRWGNPCLFEGGANSMTCRVVYIGENLFASSSKLSILSASWHPGCLTHNHVAVLSNDNFFRVYRLTNPTLPDFSVAVGKTTSVGKDHITLNCDSAMGELAVDFSFGGPILPEKYKPDLLKDDPEVVRKRFLEFQWPVFVLHANGDVYYVLISISKNRCDQRTLYGPMAMLPSAYDNYGLDYCSLIVLLCSPQVLVIANTAANVHHCIVMEKSLNHQCDTDSVESITQGINDIKLKAPNYQLHVYESIKLELSFIADAPKVNSNILLIADPDTPSRYWISHIEGVHGVSFPFVDRLMHIDDGNFDLELCNDVATTVEHFLCTKPISSVKSLPVIGLTFNQSPVSVLVLLASGLIYTFPIPNSFIPYVPCTGSVSLDQRNSSNFPVDSFSKHIRSLLYRSISQPLLISGSIPDLESNEYLCMIATYVRTLKKNYLQPQVKVREALQMRVNILLEQKKNLLLDIELMLREKNPLTEESDAISDKYEQANERHSNLITRLEKVMSRIVSDLPTLSSTERAMMNELAAIKERSEGFQREISQLKSKQKWQKDEIQKQESKEGNEGSTLSESEVNFLENSLKSESTRLKIMTKKVTQLKSEVDM